MSSRSSVLSLFRSLHRTARRVFRGDQRAIKESREKINQEFRKYKSVESQTAREELIKMGQECQNILSTQVIQAELKSPSASDDPTFKLHIRPETHMWDNNPFRDDISEEEYIEAEKNTRIGKRKQRTKCAEEKKE